MRSRVCIDMTIQQKNFSTDVQFVKPVALATQHSVSRSGFYRSFVKRLIDVAAVLAFAPIVLPFVVFLGILVALDGRNPFYSQKRVGRDGKIFTMWKLRTMVPNAETKLQAHLDTNPDARAEWDDMQKLSCDPRITRLGRVLRKTSLDELPQLWNVFAGDMSLVGPRPMLPEQQRLYPGAAYYEMRPGITGYWQISDRNQTTFAARASYDNQYYRDVSLTTDLSVLTSTIAVVLRGTGC